jgi:uncharacterized membrane protein
MNRFLSFEHLCRFSVVVGLVATIGPTIVILGEVVLTARGAPAITRGLEMKIGANICHHIPERTIAIRQMTLPVCARCSGMYAGCVTGTVIGLILPAHRRIGRGMGLLLSSIVLALCTAIFLAAAEHFGFVHTTNVTRVVLGAPLGFAPALMLCFAARVLRIELLRGA